MAVISDDLNWDDIRIFLAIAQTGNLTQAAKLLRRSQPTIGRRLRALEKALGAQLFDRLPNRLAMTGFGEQLLAAAEAMQSDAAMLARHARAGSPRRGSPVRVTATSSVALFLTLHLDALAELCPDIEITVIGTRAVQNLAENEAEIALRMRRIPAQGNLTARKIGGLAFALYASQLYCARHGLDGKGAIDMRGLDFIGLPETSRRPSQSRWLDELAARHQGKVAYRLSEMMLRHRAASLGRGVTLLPCFLGDAETGLRRLLEPPPELIEEVYLLRHTDLLEAAEVRVVAEAIRHLFRRKARELLGKSSARSARAAEDLITHA